MTSVVISADERELCSVVGRGVADALGYEHVGRALLAEVARRHKVAEDKLRSVLVPDTARQRSAATRALLMAYIEEATLKKLRQGNVVCSGLLAQLCVGSVSSVLSVRVLADVEPRAERLAAEEGISLRAARIELSQHREEQAKSSIECYGADLGDPALHDLVIGLGQIDLDMAIGIIGEVAGYRSFALSTYARRCLDELAAACQLRIALLPRYPHIRVAVEDGAAIIHAECLLRNRRRVVKTITKMAKRVRGVEQVEVVPVRSLQES